MLARILARLGLGRSEAPPAPAVTQPAPQIVVGEGASPPPAVPPAAVDLVAEFEGFRTDAYLCPAKVWTIGYGATRWGNGQPVVKGDGPITEDAARRLLRQDLEAAARALDALVMVPLAEGQRAALISFIYNVGRGAFARSTMLVHINAGRMDSAASEFTRWVKAGGQVLPGLARRRAAEAKLFRGSA